MATPGGSETEANARGWGAYRLSHLQSSNPSIPGICNIDEDEVVMLFPKPLQGGQFCKHFKEHVFVTF
jgi:hypothetical protein